MPQDIPFDFRPGQPGEIRVTTQDGKKWLLKLTVSVFGVQELEGELPGSGGLPSLQIRSRVVIDTVPDPEG